MQSFTELTAWKSGMQLVKQTYLLTQKLPKSEQYGLIQQLRRSCTSVLANLAEGFSRRTPADKSHKYTIARGECSETAALLLITVELGLLESDEVKDALSYAEETGKLLSGLIHAHMLNEYPTPYSQRPTP